MSSIMRWRSGDTAAVFSSLMVVLQLVARHVASKPTYETQPQRGITGSSLRDTSGSQPCRASGLVLRPNAGDHEMTSGHCEERSPNSSRAEHAAIPPETRKLGRIVSGVFSARRNEVFLQPA